MVMEYLPGGDCFTLLQSFGFLEENLARWFCAEALLGLQYLHGCSIIHRDVKCVIPSNPRLRASCMAFQQACFVRTARHLHAYIAQAIEHADHRQGTHQARRLWPLYR